MNVSASPSRRTPRSAYNPTVSGDGRRVAYESAEGNLNFAKRYGQIRVFVADTATGRTTAMPTPKVRAGVSLSAYNPAISADGRHVAYQAQRRGGQSAVYVTDLRSGRSTLASRGARGAPRADDGVYDPAISGNGRFVAFTTAASNLGAGDLHGRTQVFVRDLRSAHDDARQPRDRRARRGRGRLLRRRGDLARRPLRRVLVGGAQPRGRQPRLARSSSATCGRAARAPSAARPASRSSRRSARTGASWRTRRSRAARSRVLVRDRAAGREQLVSRATGSSGAAADGASSDAAISADGTRVAFTSAATNLSAAKPDDRRGVFVRDLRKQTTTLVSAPVPKAALAAAAAAAPAAGPKARSGERRAGAQRRAAAHVGRLDLRQRVLPRARPPDRAPAAGGVLTWKWSSQQSHQVTLRSGPEPVRSPAKAAGVYSARLTKPGTYEFVCAIHAPGMRMAAVVQ